jgi:hypothetical protein
VIEMGMNHRGEIARLVEIARPSVGLLTNVGTAHIEFLGSEEEIALEKGDLVAGLPVDGTAVLNFDDPRVVEQKGRAPGRVLSYARETVADVTARDVRRLPGGRYAFAIETPEGSAAVELTGLGETTIINALAAAAAALASGASLSDVVRGLADYRPIAGRMAPRAHTSGATVIDDSYNANPQSPCSATGENSARRRTPPTAKPAPWRLDSASTNCSPWANVRPSSARERARPACRLLGRGSREGPRRRRRGPKTVSRAEIGYWSRDRARCTWRRS